jgi:hypothetical protein
MNLFALDFETGSCFSRGLSIARWSCLIARSTASDTVLASHKNFLDPLLGRADGCAFRVLISCEPVFLTCESQTRKTAKCLADRDQP